MEPNIAKDPTLGLLKDINCVCSIDAETDFVPYESHIHDMQGVKALCHTCWQTWRRREGQPEEFKETKEAFIERRVQYRLKEPNGPRLCCEDPTRIANINVDDDFADGIKKEPTPIRAEGGQSSMGWL